MKRLVLLSGVLLALGTIAQASPLSVDSQSATRMFAPLAGQVDVLARHGADDPAGDDRGHHGRGHK
ncbi:MAG: hypothetical protein JSR87_09280 [Proteobacteria bacterium]|nr:hypothetical protein [Pseudomonadota bacterium]MBS0572808.1 hypothetical protein [Pseudomonadota bacterium]